MQSAVVPAVPTMMSCLGSGQGKYPAAGRVLPGCTTLHVKCAAEHARWMPQDLEKVLEPIFFHYKEKRRAEEPFGDFCARIGFDQLRSYSAAYVPPESVSSLPQVRAHLANRCRHADMNMLRGKARPFLQGRPLSAVPAAWAMQLEPSAGPGVRPPLAASLGMLPPLLCCWRALHLAQPTCCCRPAHRMY